MRFKDNCAKYVIKEGNYITNFTDEEIKTMVDKANTPEEKFNRRLVAQELMAGRPLLELLVLYPTLYFELSKLQESERIFKRLNCPVPEWVPLENEWIWGPTGAGKSKSVNERYPKCFRKPKDLFWDGYTDEKIVYMEDVDSTWGECLYDLKIWADHYRVDARIKHKPPVIIRPEHIIVTSNYTIRECYERMFKSTGRTHDEELILAIERRFKQIRMDIIVNPDPLDVLPENYFFDNLFDF